MPKVSLSFVLLILAIRCLVPVDTLVAQKKSTLANRVTKLEQEVTVLSEKVKTLEGRLSGLEALRAFRSPEELRYAMIQASKGAIINDLNNLASSAYQFRIRPTTMGGGGGSYAGFTIPKLLVSNGNADYEAVASSDSVVIFTGISKQKVGTVKAILDRSGQLGSFEFTGEFQ